MASNVYQAISKESMVAGFPATIQGIIGEPTQCKLLHVFRHMITCSHSYVTNYCDLNWLFLVIPHNMWQYYTSDAPDQYPAPPTYPGDASPYDDNSSAVVNTVIRDIWQSQQKDFVECMHMNKALTERFLSIFANKHRRGYNATIVSDLNRTFGPTFVQFNKQFWIRDEAEIEQNRDDMRKPWNIADGWEVLKERFDDGIAYAVFTDAQINAADALNMLISVLLKTGVFQAQYEEWHAIPQLRRFYF